MEDAKIMKQMIKWFHRKQQRIEKKREEARRLHQVQLEREMVLQQQLQKKEAITQWRKRWHTFHAALDQQIMDAMAVLVPSTTLEYPSPAATHYEVFCLHFSSSRWITMVGQTGYYCMPVYYLNGISRWFYYALLFRLSLTMQEEWNAEERSIAEGYIENSICSWFVGESNPYFSWPQVNTYMD